MKTFCHHSCCPTTFSFQSTTVLNTYRKSASHNKLLLFLYLPFISTIRSFTPSRSAIVFQDAHHQFLIAPSNGQLFAAHFHFCCAECLYLVFCNDKRSMNA